MRVRSIGMAMLAVAGMAEAQPNTPDRWIAVTGAGVDRAMPDVAFIEFSVRGEGDDADGATRALADRQKAVMAGLAGLLKDAKIATRAIVVNEVRDPKCTGMGGYGVPMQRQASCPVTGYAASAQGSVRTGEVAKAGTAAGLALRLGAADARLSGFTLADPDAAQRRATILALRDARARAEVAAQGAGVRLGKVMTVRDQQGFQNSYAPVITPSAPPAVMAPVAAPPPPPPPPIVVSVEPGPIETRATVSVSYDIVD